MLKEEKSKSKIRKFFQIILIQKNETVPKSKKLLLKINNSDKKYKNTALLSQSLVYSIRKSYLKHKHKKSIYNFRIANRFQCPYW